MVLSLGKSVQSVAHRMPTRNVKIAILEAGVLRLDHNERRESVQREELRAVESVTAEEHHGQRWQIYVKRKRKNNSTDGTSRWRCTSSGQSGSKTGKGELRENPITLIQYSTSDLFLYLQSSLVVSASSLLLTTREGHK